MLVHCSTQHPSEMQHVVAHVLGLHSHNVHVRMPAHGRRLRRQGIAVGAVRRASRRSRRASCSRPVKLRVDRDDDFMITGKRHCFYYDYEVGFDDDGRLLGAELTMVSRAGFSADLSGPVVTRAVCHFDNAYFAARRRDPRLFGQDQHAEQHRVPRLRRTAGRDRDRVHPRLIARTLGARSARRAPAQPLRHRRAQRHAVRPDRSRTTSSTPLVDELEADSDYRARRAAIAAFNATSPVLKRGLAITPVKFGISFNVAHLNQAGALVHVYTDGSILVNHGGTEMGQGLNTKVAQVVAHELGVVVRARARDRHRHAARSPTPRPPPPRPAAT